MIDKIEVKGSNYHSPCTNFLKARKEILDVIIKYECSMSDFKCIVDEIIDRAIAENKINIKISDPL